MTLLATDRVAYKQKAPNGFAQDLRHSVWIEDGKAYIVHRGTVKSGEPTTESDEVVVEWDDGDVTTTEVDKLDMASEVDYA